MIVLSILKVVLQCSGVYIILCIIGTDIPDQIV